MTAAEIVERLRISEVFRSLGGEVRGHRGRAFWRNGDGWNVALDDAKGTWFDHRDSVGGGLLDLVMLVRGTDRRAAIDWLAELAGAELDKPKPCSAHGERRIEAEYDYTGEAGELLYQVIRFDPKGFTQRRPDGAGGWIWKKSERQVLYHLPEVIASNFVVIVEGEKDVETLRAHGLVATCEAGGANAPWLDAYTDALRGKEVVLIPDNDEPGQQRGDRIARALLGHVARLSLVESLDGSKDVTQWMQSHSGAELLGAIFGEVAA